MITGLFVENFKSWEYLELIANKITGLFGANSSGKSTILQFLLMLKQTKEATDRTLALNFGDSKSYVNLGSFKEAIHRHDRNTMDWELWWNIPKQLKISDPQKSSRSILFEVNKLFINSSVSTSKYGLESDYIKYGIGDVNDPQFFLKKMDQAYTLGIDNMDYKFIRNPGRVWELPPPVKSYNFPDQVQTYYQNTAFLSQFVFEYEQLMDRIFYLGPLREYPQRDYTWTGSSPVDVGKRGEKAIDAILAAKAKQEMRNLGYKMHYIEFDEFIAYWLKEIGMIHTFNVKEIAPSTGLYRVWIKKTKDSPEALITDVGFGVSQILPVLVLLYYVPAHSIVLLEQPEIHLHPAVQSGLADIIINAVKTRNIQVIVESHSEHLLKRLQRRTAEGLISNNDISLYFCELKGSKSNLTELELDEYGSISNWPEDFFGDTFGELAAIQEEGLKRKLRRRK